MSFVLPLLLGGLALIGLPYLIHHIRRPEREPVIFSSLMFLPNVKKEVIERRRLQHILLMILRMALLILLALAFARPFQTQRQSYVQETAPPGRHLILIDTSYSMAMGERGASAAAKAREIIAQIPDDIPVGLISFAASPRTLVPLDGDLDQNRRLLERALDDLTPGQNGTAYRNALQYAEGLLLEGMPPEETAPAVLHLISDFARSGMPETGSDWRLSGRILFRGHTVDTGVGRNLSLTELGRLDDETNLNMAGKIKNWSLETEETVVVQFHLDGAVVAEQQVTIAPGGASQVRFSIPRPDGEKHEGKLQIKDDDFALDNTRWFVWKAPEKKTILLTAARDTQRWPADFFIEHALNDSGDVPWQLRRTRAADLPRALNSNPDMVILLGTEPLQNPQLDALDRYLETGGRILLALGESEPPPRLMQMAGIDYRAAPGQRRAQAAGVLDFDHPTLLAFRGSRFNDFTGLRFYQSHQLTPLPEGNTSVVAALESRQEGQPGDPFILEHKRGDGRLIVWSFLPNLNWTNMPRTPRFVPMLHETVKYMGRFREEEKRFLVGDDYLFSAGEQQQKLILPNGDEETLDAGEAPRRLTLSSAGILRLATDGSDSEPLDAINLPGGESDPETIDVDEFALRLTTSGGDLEGGVHGEIQRYAGEVENRREYGFLAVLLAAALIIVELFYARKLSIRKTETSTP